VIPEYFIEPAAKHAAELEDKCRWDTQTPGYRNMWRKRVQIIGMVLGPQCAAHALRTAAEEAPVEASLWLQSRAAWAELES
jgi:hypothetical protein